ncbi:LysM domain-containing protein [Paracidovorax avenae]|uniref:LysM peptidoglycan-binding domain-containing protein n=1 Tax=Paracidovorax TaxID=3051137 RepID=UPI0009FF05E2|nr:MULTISPECIES: LysM domain-containing protein [Paracidovorax]AVS76639.1 LysM domain-containing protein [Paracidovorax avenae]AVS92911.1 LysM domain-containing protein [Paracidovorax avenae]AVS97408.1 LysM domain-containing protein [Paracidovorax avenae]
MAEQGRKKTGFEKWQEGIDKAVQDVRWNDWDCEIQLAVNEYNQHLSGVAGYIPLDWYLIKSMVWVETGANSPEWKIKPMQIGVAGDPGMASLLSGDEGGDLILPPNWKSKLTSNTVRAIPQYNLRAGIGYLLMKMGNYEYRNLTSSDEKYYEVVVKPGDSFEKIARKNGSTVETIQKLNPNILLLRPGQVLKYQKSSIQRTIKSWRTLSTQMVAQRYNGGGDPYYARKLDYVLPLLRKGKAAICEK